MKFVLTLITLYAACAGADQTKLGQYLGDWTAVTPADGCFSPIRIESNSTGVSILRGDGVTNVPRSADYRISPEAQTNLFDGYKLSTNTVAKFVRGKIVSAHIWNADNDAFLGVGMRVWLLNAQGNLIKKKAGISIGTKKNNEGAKQIYDLDSEENMITWAVECEYTKAR